MLTAEHVLASKKRGELVLRPLGDKLRERALELAAAYLEITRAHVGKTRDELRQALAAVPLSGREKKLGDGLLKLLEDASEFTAESAVDPIELRRKVFECAARQRRNPESEAYFDRERVLAEVGEEIGLSPADIESALYSDLRGAHVLLRFSPIDADALLRRYERGQVQAVLLRAVRVVAEVDCRSAAGYRHLFRQLKFRRLLHRIVPREGSGYSIEIDGPYSLFDSVTKYGLQLALALPALQACDRLSLVAEVRWGKEREPLLFRWSSERDPSGEWEEPAHLPDEVLALMNAFQLLSTPWTVSATAEILELPGIGLCVPDVVFEHPDRGRVYFEALGFWSRDAVWKRIELAKNGLDVKILFAASHRLRVSESVLEDSDHAALYVYKGALNARAIERKLDGLTR